MVLVVTITIPCAIRTLPTPFKRRPMFLVFSLWTAEIVLIRITIRTIRILVMLVLMLVMLGMAVLLLIQLQQPTLTVHGQDLLKFIIGYNHSQYHNQVITTTTSTVTVTVITATTGLKTFTQTNPQTQIGTNSILPNDTPSPNSKMSLPSYPVLVPVVVLVMVLVPVDIMHPAIRMYPASLCIPNHPSPAATMDAS